MNIITDLIQGHFELGGSLLVDIVESDRVLLAPDIGDGHEANPVGLRAGRGVGRCGDIKVRMVHKHADVLKRRNTLISRYTVMLLLLSVVTLNSLLRLEQTKVAL